MARPREFDPDVVLDQAMQIFWAKGYYATSLNDLCTSMQLNRSSLYGEFRDKRALFLKSIDLYGERVVTDALAALSGPVSIREALAAFLADIIDQVATGPGQLGCFIGNTAAEVARHDRAVATKVKRNLDRLEAVFHDAFAQAQARGEISRRCDVTALARFFVTAVQGLRLIGKTTTDRARLEDIKEVILQVVEG